MTEPGRGPGGSDDYAGRQERGQKGLHPRAYKQTGRRSSQEREGTGTKSAGQADPLRSELDIGRTPTPSIVQGGESEST